MSLKFIWPSRAVASLPGRVLVVSGAVLVLLTGVLAALLVTLDQSDRARQAQVRSARIAVASAQVEKAVLDMETGLRGYALTGARRFLQPWYSGRAAFAPGFARLNALTGRDPSGEGGVVAAIGQQGEAYIRAFGEPLLRDPLASARRVSSVAEGKRRIDALRALFGRLSAINGAQTAQRLAAVRASTSRLRTIALAGIASALLLIALSGWYLARRVSWPIRRIARAADSITIGELSVRVPEEGPGEVGELGRSFNAMADSIVAGQRRLSAKNESLREARAAAELTARELAAQQDIAVDLISTVGFDGTFKRVNPAWERTLGYPEAELVGRPFIDFVHPEDRERTEAEAVRLAAEATDTLSFENRYRTREGGYRWLDWNVRPLAEQQLLYAVARDVTDRKLVDEEIGLARDEAQRANLAKSEFLSRMSHELRTPLNAILGFGQLLEMDAPGGTSGESVAQILQAGRHLLALIEEVLDISRIEAGTMRISVEPVDVVSALGDVVALIAPVAVESGISVSVKSGAVGDCYVQADRQRLRQVLLNLLSNAVKYNRPNGTVQVAFACDAEQVRIAVTDTGPGIAAEKLDQLFVAFDRLGAERGEVEGTGLGLALSKSLVEQMGGTLEVASTVGEGSVFTVNLAAAPNPIDQRSLTSARRTSEEVGTLGAGTILHIEDNPSNSKLVEQAFTGQAGVRLMLAMQGSAGVDLARAHQPDLILLDLNLPDMHGADVLAALQADPSTATIPVVVMSADATPGQVRALLSGGAKAYLTKPLNVREFLSVIAEHLPSSEPVQ